MAFQPPGKRSRASSFDTDGTMITSSPHCQFTGVATLCFAVSWHDSSSLRSEEHTSELQSLMRISYAVFCVKKKKNDQQPVKKVKHIAMCSHNIIKKDRP